MGMAACRRMVGMLKPRRWFVPRYSLRTLLVVMTVVCLVSGFWLNKAFRQRDAVRRFNQLTANRPDSHGEHMVTTLYRHGGAVHSAPIVPEWLHPLRDLIGVEAFGEVVGVQLTGTATTDNDLRYLLDVSSVDNLWLSRTKVTDAGMRHLRACPKLGFLTLDNTIITDAGVAQLMGLSELNSLSLSGTKITDAGLEHVAKMTKLKELWLRGTAITDAGYRKLQAALPECEIQADVPAYYEKSQKLHWGGYQRLQTPHYSGFLNVPAASSQPAGAN